MKLPKLSTLSRLLSLIAPLSLLLTLVLMTTFTRNVSDSAAPVGWYRVHWNAPVKEGDLVLLRMPIKQVWARVGDHVSFTPKGIYVQGHLVPNSQPEPGITQVCPYGDYTVPDGMFLGLGTNDPDSWDSRYLCFLPETLIAGTVTSLWTNH
jgi:type IV secretory pathway protease TraF